MDLTQLHAQLRVLALPHTASDLVVECPAFSPSNTCTDALCHFGAHPQFETLPVVDDGRPVGLIARKAFIERFARPFHRELYGAKSCTVFMDQTPLVVERDEPIVMVGAKAAQDAPKALLDGFVVTSRGRYAGVGTGQSLIRALSDIELARSRQMMESVRYASRIQRALLHTSNEQLAQWLPNHRVLWEPRDVVGGDYYFCRGDADRVLIIVIDCTGHGVPGALMTMVMTASIENAAAETPSLDPGLVLANVNRRVRQALGQNQSNDISSTEIAAPNDGPGDGPNDGMDAAAVLIDRRAGTLSFSGARLPMFLWYPQAGWICLPAGRLGVGYTDTPDDAQWPVSRQPLQPGLRLTIATDGVFDQVGGPNAIAFGKKRFAEALGVAGAHTLHEQFESAWSHYGAWQDTQQRRDDVTMMMIEV